MTTISIVTVCFNSAGTIRDTIESVAGQRCPGIEHIIVDGGSTDGTMDIIREYDGYLAAVIAEPDEGIYDAMNKGIRAATGDIIGILNSDDFYPCPRTLSTVVDAFSDKSTMVCYGDLCYVSSKAKDQIVRYWKSSEFKHGHFSRGWCPPHPALFARREVYDRYGLFDTRIEIAADAELMIRFLERHSVKAVYIPEVLVHMRLGGVTNRSLSNIWKQNVEIWRALKAHDLSPSIMRFAFGKMMLRARQYLSRPRD